MSKNNKTYLPESYHLGYYNFQDSELESIHEYITGSSSVAESAQESIFTSPWKEISTASPFEEVSYPIKNTVQSFSKEEYDRGDDLKLRARCIINMDDASCIGYRKTTEDPMQLENFNEDHYSYPVVRNCVNLAIQDYLIQTKLKYEFVEIEKASVLMLGGALFYITFKAMSHQKELTTFEAEVFHCADETKVWRVRIKNPGTAWFDGKFYVPRPEKDNKLYFPGPEQGGKLFLPKPGEDEKADGGSIMQQLFNDEMDSWTII